MFTRVQVSSCPSERQAVRVSCTRVLSLTLCWLSVWLASCPGCALTACCVVVGMHVKAVCVGLHRLSVSSNSCSRIPSSVRVIFVYIYKASCRVGDNGGDWHNCWWFLRLFSWLCTQWEFDFVWVSVTSMSWHVLTLCVLTYVDCFQRLSSFIYLCLVNFMTCNYVEKGTNFASSIITIDIYIILNKMIASIYKLLCHIKHYAIFHFTLHYIVSTNMSYLIICTEFKNW